jgi:glutaredoxin
MIFKAVREGLGRLIVFIDWATRPKPLARSAEEQELVDQATRAMSLYQFYACPFCVRTRRAMHRLNLNIEVRDAQNDPKHREALSQEGGALQVPCLRIDEDEASTWMYESADIIAYLEKRFGSATGETQSSGAKAG